MELKRYTAVYTGRVQGVGFRFTAVHLARKFKTLTGYVRNLPDGSVEVVAEGDQETSRRFLESIRESELKPWILDVKTEETPIRDRHYTSFNIHV